MEKKQVYQSPVLTVVTFRVESGFVESGGTPSQMDFMLFEDSYEGDHSQASSFGEQNWSW